MWYNWAMSKTKIKITADAHSPASFARKLLTPLFESGKIPLYEGATEYAICYGELCAYRGEQLLAVFDRNFPDTANDKPLDESSLDGGQWHEVNSPSFRGGCKV
jgi:hypothetical protein